jgi:hypothetical protein
MKSNYLFACCCLPKPAGRFFNFLQVKTYFHPAKIFGICNLVLKIINYLIGRPGGSMYFCNRICNGPL